MQLTELQIGLIALGVAGVGAVVGYNMWQERRHRQTAERALGESRHDVLIDTPYVPAERVEPTLDFDLSDGTEDIPPPAPAEPAREAPVVPAVDEAPANWADERVEQQVVIDLETPVAATELLRAWNELTQSVDVAVRLRGRDDRAGRWLALTSDTAGMLSRVELAIQLADRRGPLSESALSALAHALQGLADRFLAVVHFPDVRELLGRARELDSFAASVDVQIGLNLVAGDTPISGTKLRGLAEAQGFVLYDGLFHARDDAGATLYTLGNLDAAQFAPDTMKTLQTQGVTLLLDVPTVADGARQFDRMVAQAEQFAQALGAKVVDDNRHALSAASLSVIRGKIAEFQGRMDGFGIAPGSESARRLFS
ncbi:MAG TPA: cell division protein ZipA C-terminal FtsZ-binding domain-containing protein [Methyloversatilis sp.]